MHYEGSVYRPPSEAYSLIVQATIGCSNNRCVFCSMYKDKQFRARPVEDVIADFHEARSMYRRVSRIFLADGDALVLSSGKLLTLLTEIGTIFPECERVSVYGTPQDILRKTPDEFKALANAGLRIIYIGAESGDDDVLRRIRKGVTADEIISAIRRVQENGIEASVTFISGLGGMALSEQHAVGCARIMTEAGPAYAALLTLLLEPGAPMYENVRNGTFVFMKPEEIARETLILLDCSNPGTDCVFRSNHASNYIPLKGTLPRDKTRLIETLQRTLEQGAFKDDLFRLL